MKKTYILLPLGLLCTALGASFVSADSPALVASIQGSPLTFVSVTTENNGGTYRDGKDLENKEITSEGTSTDEHEDATTTTKDTKDTKDTKNENSLRVGTTTNFEIDGERERANGNRGALISDMAKIQSGEDFRLFVLSLVNKNKDITNVSSQEDRVSVTRNVTTKLFGFIPSSMRETIEVISWGNGTEQVMVTRPWWSFFAKDATTTNAISANIEFRIKNISKEEFKTVLDVTTKARIISEIEAAFRMSDSASTTITN